MYTSWPNTGVIRSYNLRIENTTCNPDGAGSRVCMLINGRTPGPTIVANWGDTIRVTVRNLLAANGTSIHWHGFRMLNTNIQDGTNGITECALAPSDIKTYQFQATEYGTSWYHSHFSHQYGDGVVGTVQVNGPATANYDIDLGVLPITDWYYLTAYQAAARAFQNGQAGLGPPAPDNILINGTAKSATGRGAYYNVTIQAGKKYRLRLVNTSVDTNLRVNLDGHPFSVISTDFVPIVPYTTNYIKLGIGQRYDVVFTANQTAGNYWFRAEADTGCSSQNARAGRAVFTYSGQTVADPTSIAPTPVPAGCLDPVTTPQIAKNVPNATFVAQAKSLPVAFGPVVANGNTVLWTVNGTSMSVDPGNPTVKYVATGNNNFPQSYNVVEVPSSSASTWTYWIIQQTIPVAHPIHLHGHDAYIIGQGTGTFNVTTMFSQLRFTNPPRRDVAQLPPAGYLVLGYPTDNPGAWLMHCHIAFHVGMGLSVQFLERKSQITLPATGSEWDNNCQNWAAYKAGNTDIYPQDDSGLRKRWNPMLEGRSPTIVTLD
ncbi:hypothetical protein NX059_004869 [Plenodomus lindquistii]|nr:hypothetical protein NX059_004869 [Plenodomus lindquistii]